MLIPWDFQQSMFNRRLFQIGVATKTFYSLDYCGSCFFMIWTRIVIMFISSWVLLTFGCVEWDFELHWAKFDIKLRFKSPSCKSWNQPQGLYTRRQGWNRKNLFNLPQVTNKCWTLPPWFGPKAEKRIPYNLGSQFATLGSNVSAFINILPSMF
jgi:hypothetical protein